MKITRLYTGMDGESPFENKDIIEQLSNKIDVSGMLIHQFNTDFKVDWYNPPLGKIYVIFLEGQQEISVGDGTSRVFGYGDIFCNFLCFGRRDGVSFFNCGVTIIY